MYILLLIKVINTSLFHVHYKSTENVLVWWVFLFCFEVFFVCLLFKGSVDLQIQA